MIQTLRTSSPVFNTATAVLAPPATTPVEQSIESAAGGLDQRVAANGIGRVLNVTA